MSLWLTVGSYSREADEEFIPINPVLRAVGLPELPSPAQPETYWTQEIGRTGCFCFLRRLAAYVAAGHELPKPSLDFDEVWKDPIFQQYYQRYPVKRSVAAQKATELSERPADDIPLSAIGRVASPFAHLMQHEADQGYYLPIPFSEVIVTYEGIHDWCEPIAIGSCHSLREECGHLAGLLNFPPDLELKELEKLARRAQDLHDRPGWERFAFECFMCKALMVGAHLAIQSGCVLQFG
jgi:hypothetical protein